MKSRRTRVTFTFSSALINYLMRCTIPSSSEIKHAICDICSQLESILYAEKLTFIEEPSALKLFWQDKEQKLISYLVNLFHSQKLEKATFYKVVLALKEFLNSRDLEIAGRYEKSSLLGISLVKPTQAFKEFNEALKLLSEKVKLDLDRSSKHSSPALPSTKSVVLEILQVVKKGLSYLANNPVAVLALIAPYQGILAQVTQPKTNLDNGLVAYFPFNTNALDATGHGNDGIVYGAMLTEDRFNRRNQAYYFDGNSYIKGSATNFPTGSRTVAMWIKPSISGGQNTDTGGAVFGYGGNIINPPCQGNGWFMRLYNLRTNPPNKYEVQAQCGTGRTFYDDSRIYQPSDWIHFAATTDYYSGTRIYINGVWVSNLNNAFITTVVENKDFGIGTLANLTGGVPPPVIWASLGYNNFQGGIDDVRIYGRALSSEEMRQRYEMERREPCDNEELKLIKEAAPAPTPLPTPAPVKPCEEAARSEETKNTQYAELFGAWGAGMAMGIGLFGLGLFAHKKYHCHCTRRDKEAINENNLNLLDYSSDLSL